MVVQDYFYIVSIVFLFTTIGYFVGTYLNDVSIKKKLTLGFISGIIFGLLLMI